MVRGDVTVQGCTYKKGGGDFPAFYLLRWFCHGAYLFVRLDLYQRFIRPHYRGRRGSFPPPLP